MLCDMFYKYCVIFTNQKITFDTSGYNQPLRIPLLASTSSLQYVSAPGLFTPARPDPDTGGATSLEGFSNDLLNQRTKDSVYGAFYYNQSETWTYSGMNRHMFLVNISLSTKYNY